MAAAFMYDDLVAGAAFIGDLNTIASASMPLTNLSDPQPRVRTRWAGSVSLYIDFGSAVDISCVGLISTSLGVQPQPGDPVPPGGTGVRVQLGNDAGFGTANWDTGTLTPTTDPTTGGNVVMVHATSASGRYMRLDISDPVSPVIDVGRIVAGPLWRTSYAWAYGAGEGRLMLDRRDRNTFTGAEFPVPAIVNPRVMTFGLEAITSAEAIGEFRTMLDTLGAVGDALWIPDDGLALAEMNRRAIFGAVAQPGETALLTRANFRLHRRSFNMVERV